MLNPVEMRKLHVLILGKYLNTVTVALGESGYVHLVDAVHQSRDRLLSEVDRQSDIDTLQGLYQSVTALMNNLGLPTEHPEAPPRDFSLNEIRTLLQEVEQRFQQEDDAINELISESGTLTKEQQRLGSYPFRHIRFGELRDLDHLYIRSGRIPPGQLPELAGTLGDKGLLLHDFDEHLQEERVLILSSRRNRWALDSELGKSGFRQEDIPAEAAGTAEDEERRVRDRLAGVRTAIEKHRERVRALAEQYGTRLAAMCAQLRSSLAIANAQQHFGKAAQLYCISGWVPSERQQDVVDLVEEATGGTAIVEVVTPFQDERVRRGVEKVPVKFPKIAPLKPFQRLVTAFGAPRYGEIEPSLYVAVSFVIMFGLMFGDVGQGAVIALAGLYMLRTKRPSLKPFSDIGYLLLFCGLAAAAFGVLYGSLFGNEHILRRTPGFRALALVQPLRDVMLLFKAAIVLGIVFISGGMLLNIVNRFRAHHYVEGVLDRFGVVGVIFYWSCIGLGLKLAVHGRLSGLEIALFIVLPLVLLFLKEPIEALLHRKGPLLHEDPVTFVLASAMEVMETLTTWLGSTVSFVRLGGFALSHAALCLAIYSLVEVIRDVPGSGLWAALIIVTGNLFIILLEGMVVSIQGIRLQYYELFSKYFAGDGVLYAPFRLATTNRNTEET